MSAAVPIRITDPVPFVPSSVTVDGRVGTVSGEERRAENERHRPPRK